MHYPILVYCYFPHCLFCAGRGGGSKGTPLCPHFFNVSQTWVEILSSHYPALGVDVLLHLIVAPVCLLGCKARL